MGGTKGRAPLTPQQAKLRVLWELPLQRSEARALGMALRAVPGLGSPAHAASSGKRSGGFVCWEEMEPIGDKVTIFFPFEGTKAQVCR